MTPARFTLIAAISLSLLAPLAAQSAPSAPAAAPAQLPDAPGSLRPNSGGAEKSRALGMIPRFNIVMEGATPGLTAGRKFHLFLRTSTDPFTFAVAGLSAGIGQARNNHAAYGQGAEGFGKRFGASYANSVDGAFWGDFVLPVAFKEDPRYFSLGPSHPAGRRIGHALLSQFICYNDSGRRSFNFGKVLGHLIAGGISNTYYPRNERGVGLTFRSDAIVTLISALGTVGQEFVPDLQRVLHRTPKPLPDVVSTPAPPHAK